MVSDWMWEFGGLEGSEDPGGDSEDEKRRHKMFYALVARASERRYQEAGGYAGV